MQACYKAGQWRRIKEEAPGEHGKFLEIVSPSWGEEIATYGKGVSMLGREDGQLREIRLGHNVPYLGISEVEDLYIVI